MSINRFDFSNGSQEPFSVGLNISKRFGLTQVHMFALDETAPGSINKNIWGIASAISREVLQGENISDVNWNLHVRKVSSAVKFSTFDGKPYKIDISNKTAFQYEGHPHAALSLEKYNEPAEPARLQTPMSLFKRDVINAWQHGEPMSMVCVPCAHPSLSDGVFYCNADYSNSTNMRDRYDFFLADSKLAISKLERDDPSMIEHARYKLGRITTDQWVKTSALLFPVSTGGWGNFEGRLNFQQGDASIIKVIQGANLPFFPMCVARGEGKTLQAQIGYGKDTGHVFNMQPAFTQG